MLSVAKGEVETSLGERLWIDERLLRDSSTPLRFARNDKTAHQTSRPPFTRIICPEMNRASVREEERHHPRKVVRHAPGAAATPPAPRTLRLPTAASSVSECVLPGATVTTLMLYCPSSRATARVMPVIADFDPTYWTFVAVGRPGDAQRAP